MSSINPAWGDHLGSFQPPNAVQERFVGSSGQAALSEGTRFVGHVMAHMDTTPPYVTLDFGAGWGRIAKALVPYTTPSTLWCAELLPDARAYCAAGVPGASVVSVQAEPPTMLRRGTFELITAYSVFTHLPRGLHEAWTREFAELLHPGGTIAVTYWDQWFLELCEASRTGDVKGATDWHRSLATRFDPFDEHAAKLEREGHLFVGSGGGEGLGSEHYGEAVVSRDYIADTWSDAGFDLISWDVSRTITPQAIAILRKRS